MNRPFVSIIIPIYNTGKACLKLLDIINNSTYKNIEIICIDDGSNDDSYDIVSNYIKNQKNASIKRQSNAGPSSARNRGIKNAKGDYLLFLDSDDLIDRKFIEKLVAAYDKETILACTEIQYNRLASGSSYAVFTKKIRKRKKNESLKEYILFLLTVDGRLYSAVNKMFRSDIVKRKKIRFDSSINFAEDTKFVLDYINAAIDLYPSDSVIKTIYEPLYIYNYGTETSTVSKSSLNWDNWKASYNNLKEWIGDNKTFRAQRCMFLIMLRWKLSHALAIARADMPKTEKNKYIDKISLFVAKLLIKVRKR